MLNTVIQMYCHECNDEANKQPAIYLINMHNLSHLTDFGFETSRSMHYFFIVKN